MLFGEALRNVGGLFLAKKFPFSLENRKTLLSLGHQTNTNTP